MPAVLSFWRDQQETLAPVIAIFSHLLKLCLWKRIKWEGRKSIILNSFVSKQRCICILLRGNSVICRDVFNGSKAQRSVLVRQSWVLNLLAELSGCLFPAQCFPLGSVQSSHCGSSHRQFSVPWAWPWQWCPWICSPFPTLDERSNGILVPFSKLPLPGGEGNSWSCDPALHCHVRLCSGQTCLERFQEGSRVDAGN